MNEKMLLSDLEEFLNDKKDNVNFQDENGDTLLNKAVQDIDLKRIYLLLTYKANLELANKMNRTPLCSCVWAYYHTPDPVLIKIYHTLIKAGANTQHPSGSGGPISELAEEFGLIE